MRSDCLDFPERMYFTGLILTNIHANVITESKYSSGRLIVNTMYYM